LRRHGSDRRGPHRGVRSGAFASAARAVLAAALLVARPADAQTPVVDLVAVPPGTEGLYRLRGDAGVGTFGVPVAGGLDVDGDGHADVAMAAQRASPFGRTLAGEVYLVFGDGTLAADEDSGEALPHVLVIAGEGAQEHAGSELWMDDVTGDGLADLLVARQNYSELGGRVGAGALTIVAGGPVLAQLASDLEVLDLADPPEGVALTTLVGRAALDRLGIWMRTGDVTGDGVADLAVAADQASETDVHGGEVYVVRGGPHLAGAGLVDLADLGSTALAGQILRVTADPGTAHQHFGGTVQIGDLDGDGVGELLVAATINRVGAQQRAAGQPIGSAHASGGLPDGVVFIVWDEAFATSGGPPAWPAGLSFAVSDAPGDVTAIRGTRRNTSFGEELIAGGDFDLDGALDLFVGDLIGDLTGGTRPASGMGEVIYDAARHRGRSIDLESPPADYEATRILGAAAGDIAADTAALGDFDGDGRLDLAFSAPDADPLGRVDAGRLWVLPARGQRWPEVLDLADPLPASLQAVEVRGAFGALGSDEGDTLAYSAAAGDVDGDGRDDLIVNEMRGRGVDANDEDAGNLLVLGATLLPAPGPGASLAAALAALAGLARHRPRGGGA